MLPIVFHLADHLLNLLIPHTQKENQEVSMSLNDCSVRTLWGHRSGLSRQLLTVCQSTYVDTTGPSATWSQRPSSSLSPSHLRDRFFLPPGRFSPPPPSQTLPSAVLAAIRPVELMESESTNGGDKETPSEAGGEAVIQPRINMREQTRKEQGRSRRCQTVTKRRLGRSRNAVQQNRTLRSPVRSAGLG